MAHMVSPISARTAKEQRSRLMMSLLLGGQMGWRQRCWGCCRTLRQRVVTFVTWVLVFSATKTGNNSGSCDGDELLISCLLWVSTLVPLASCWIQSRTFEAAKKRLCILVTYFTNHCLVHCHRLSQCTCASYFNASLFVQLGHSLCFYPGASRIIMSDLRLEGHGFDTA